MTSTHAFFFPDTRARFSTTWLRRRGFDDVMRAGSRRRALVWLGAPVAAAGLLLAAQLGGGDGNPVPGPCAGPGAGRTKVVSGSFRRQYKDDQDNPGWTYDARNASSSAYPFSSRYPFSAGKSFAPPHLCWIGGKVVGRQSRALTWNQMKRMYDGAGLRFASADRYVIDGLRVKNVEDGVDPRGKDVHPKDADGLVIENAYFEYIRDDCVENDDIGGGIIRDSLFDGCYTGISEQPDTAQRRFPAPPTEVLELDHVLLRLQAMPGPYGTHDPTRLGHGQLFKWYPQSNRLDVHDSVFLVESTPRGATTSFPAGTTASNVTVVWLGPGPFPGSFPPGVTITRDRRVWDEAKATWLARHGCVSFDRCTRLTRPDPY